MNPAPAHRQSKSLVAIDLGAESCRVSLLRWANGVPSITMVHRFTNGPVWDGEHFRWDLRRICAELETGLRGCADLAPEGIASIGVTGWAVDYVRLDTKGKPLGQPFCYRDQRNNAAMEAVHTRMPAEALYARTGVQIQTINTLYQLWADRGCGLPDNAPWVNLPEYILHWLGAPVVAEYSNATHTGLVDPERRQWDEEIFRQLGFDSSAAPRLVSSGTSLGPLCGELKQLPAFAGAQLIAPACHDTASAVAGIRTQSGSWAYLSSGTWSLLGALLSETLRSPEARRDGFTNLGAAGGGVLFHSSAHGMWLLRQCLNTWEPPPRSFGSAGKQHGWELAELIAAARRLSPPEHLLDLDDPAFIAPGDMPARINDQLQRRGLTPLPPGCEAAPQYANLIFYSLASRYAVLLDQIAELTGKRPERICVVGGGSRNEYLNQLTAVKAGVPVERGPVESSTLGNFAIQWARLQQDHDGVSPTSIDAALTELAEAQDNAVSVS